jgi:hypothetical protein
MGKDRTTVTIGKLRGGSTKNNALSLKIWREKNGMEIVKKDATAFQTFQSLERIGTGSKKP